MGTVGPFAAAAEEGESRRRRSSWAPRSTPAPVPRRAGCGHGPADKARTDCPAHLTAPVDRHGEHGTGTSPSGHGRGPAPPRGAAASPASAEGGPRAAAVRGPPGGTPQEARTGLRTARRAAGGREPSRTAELRRRMPHGRTPCPMPLPASARRLPLYGAPRHPARKETAVPVTGVPRGRAGVQRQAASPVAAWQRHPHRRTNWIPGACGCGTSLVRRHAACRSSYPGRPASSHSGDRDHSAAGAAAETAHVDLARVVHIRLTPHRRPSLTDGYPTLTMRDGSSSRNLLPEIFRPIRHSLAISPTLCQTHDVDESSGGVGTWPRTEGPREAAHPPSCA